MVQLFLNWFHYFKCYSSQFHSLQQHYITSALVLNSCLIVSKAGTSRCPLKPDQNISPFMRNRDMGVLLCMGDKTCTIISHNRDTFVSLLLHDSYICFCSGKPFLWLWSRECRLQPLSWALCSSSQVYPGWCGRLSALQQDGSGKIFSSRYAMACMASWT